MFQEIKSKFAEEIVSDIIDQYAYADKSEKPWIISFIKGKYYIEKLSHMQEKNSYKYSENNIDKLLKLQKEIPKTIPSDELITNQELINIETENTKIENSIRTHLLKSVNFNNKTDFVLQHRKSINIFYKNAF